MHTSFFKLAYRDRLALAGYLFLVPSVLLFGAIVVYPFAYLVYLSGFSSSLFGPGRFVGLDNYVQMLGDPQFHQAFRVTLLWTLSVLPITALGLLVAVLLTRPWLRGAGLFRVIYFLPVVTNMVAAAFVWRWLFEPTGGVVNYFVSLLGLSKPGWLADPDWALWAMMAVGVWKQIGFALVVFMAGLLGIPRSVLEAAELDGATGWRLFRHVTLPLLNPTLVFTLVILTINAFRVFTIPYVMSAGGFTYGTPGGPIDSTRVFAIHIYDLGFRAHQTGSAAAAAMALLVITAALTFFQFKVVQRRDE